MSAKGNWSQGQGWVLHLTSTEKQGKTPESHVGGQANTCLFFFKHFSLAMSRVDGETVICFLDVAQVRTSVFSPEMGLQFLDEETYWLYCV